MNEERKRFSPPAVGGSSLLVIFAVLCLTVFAMLSMSTVLAENRLRDSSIEAVSNYYGADAEAERILSMLRNREVPEGVELSSDTPDGMTVIASYSCPISDTQNLFVEVMFENGLGDDYIILRWQAAYTADWEPDYGLNIWTGE